MSIRTTGLQWRRLRSASSDSSDLSIASTELEVRVPAGALRLAVGADGRPLFLVPLGPSEPMIEIEPCKSLEVHEAILRLRGQPVRFAELGCPETRLEAVFEDLVDTIVERVASGEPAATATKAVISEFRDLLASTPAQAPQIEKSIGLLAELRRLNALLEISPRAWNAWTGPLGGRHDFRTGSTALECKATLRSAGPRITIASIDQLDSPPGGSLFLDLQIFERDAGGDWSVASEAARACALASDDAAVLDRLRAVDCDPRDTAWSVRFSLLDEAIHPVVGDFPRLVTDHLLDGRLPRGVVGLSYQIDPAAASEPPLGDAEIRQLLEQIAHAS